MVKFIFGIIIGVLVIVFIILNIETVDINFYFWTITVNRAIMALIIFLAGGISGWLIGGIGRRRRIRKAAGKTQ